MTETAEKDQSLWLLTASPIFWAAHFLLCYLTAAIWCAKVVGLGGSLASARVAIAVYTVVALAGMGESATAGTATATRPYRTTMIRRKIGTVS